MELLSKARIKLIHSLQHKKYRLKYDKFIVEGLKITKELLSEHQNIVETIYISNPDYQSILLNSGENDRITLISDKEMRAISQMATPPGILSICHMPRSSTFPEHLSGRTIFYLDGIRDPGNLGTILRIADWFGMEYIGMSPDCVDIFNPKVIQSSMASGLRVKTCVMESDSIFEFGVPVYICDMGGKDIRQLEPPQQAIIVLGNESQGVSDVLKQRANEVIAVSGEKSLGAESLNVASVSSIIAHWLQSM